MIRRIVWYGDRGLSGVMWALIAAAFAVSNASLTEIRFSGRRRGLVRFNTVPHLWDGVPVTAV